MNYLKEDSLWTKELIHSHVNARILGISLFVLLTLLGAFVRIPLPFTPVPITAQTFFVILSGLYLKKYDGSLSQLIYVVAGFIGLPVFAGAAGGAKIILGPTGGYIIGFIVAPFLVRFIYEKLGIKNIFSKSIIALASGTALIHVLGVMNLSYFMNIGLVSAFLLGCAPFLPGAVIKVALAAEIFSFHKKFSK